MLEIWNPPLTGYANLALSAAVSGFVFFSGEIQEIGTGSMEFALFLGYCSHRAVLDTISTHAAVIVNAGVWPDIRIHV